MIEDLSIEKIEEYLGKNHDFEIMIKDETDSTNNDLKELAKSGADSGCVVIADTQRQGRGRVGRKFYSPKGSGIYMSLLLKPSLEESDMVLVTTAASVAVARGIERSTGKSPQIKWVNDLYLDNKKISGILVETVRDYRDNKIIAVVIGVGINCVDCGFPEEIKEIAGAIADASESISRNKIVAEVLKELARVEDAIRSKSFLDEYRRRSMVLGREIYVLGKENEILKAVDIDERGSLVTETKDGEKRVLFSGEISIRLNN